MVLSYSVVSCTCMTFTPQDDSQLLMPTESHVVYMCKTLDNNKMILNGFRGEDEEEDNMKLLYIGCVKSEDIRRIHAVETPTAFPAICMSLQLL